MERTLGYYGFHKQNIQGEKCNIFPMINKAIALIINSCILTTREQITAEIHYVLEFTNNK